MSTMAARINDLATDIATECNNIRALLNGRAADNTSLITTAKNNLVAAINEVKQQANALAASGGATINDNASSSSVQTYSIDKINSSIASTAQATKDAILGGAGAAYDTLKELQDLLTGEQSAINDLMTALGYRVRFDADQSLTNDQKAQARKNIGALSTVEVGNTDTNFVTTFRAGLAAT